MFRIQVVKIILIDSDHVDAAKGCSTNFDCAICSSEL